MILIGIFKNQHTADFIKHYIKERQFPINMKNVNEKLIGTILNYTEKLTSLTLNINIYTNLKNITNYDMDKKLIHLINENPANKKFFNILIGLLISNGTDTASINVQQIIDEAIFKPVKPEQKININPVNEADPEYANKLVRRIECPICFMNESNIVLNCGHIICPTCVEQLPEKKCPICKQPISSNQSIYYKKYLKYKNKYAILKKEIN